MKLSSIIAALALSVASAAPAAAATLLNGSFESGLDHWTTGGPDGVVTTDVVQPFAGPTFTPKDGAAFALLTAGGADYTTLSQTFSVDDGGVLSLWVGFLSRDDTDHDDDGFVRLVDSNNNAVDLFTSSVLQVAVQGDTGWVHVTSNSLATGVYTLVAGVRDVGDDPNEPFQAGNDSQLVLDNVAITDAAAAVPEPATWGLMILGFAGVGGMLRSRRSARVVGA